MKIVFIGGRDVRQLGGIENYMYNLATQLVRLGHIPIVYCESDHNGTEIINGFEVRFIKGLKSNLLCKPWVSLKATVRTVVKESGVDVIHYNAWPPSLWSWIPRVAGIPSLMEGHGLEWKRSKYGPKAQRIMKLMERLTARLNKNLVMCSEDQVNYFREAYGRESDCIPGGINLPLPEDGDSGNILKRFRLDAGRYFLFMGRLVQDKNPDSLIRAFVRAEMDGYKLVIAGDNQAMPDYVRYLHHITDNPDVVFTGAVYGDDKSALLRHAHVFCIPSTVEGLSIALMEAMSYKLPVIASDIQANRELLASNALFVPPGDEDSLSSAMRESLNFPSFCHYVEENYKIVETQYTWETIAQEYITYASKLVKP